MDNVNNRIIELESELSRINAELERASGREQEYVEARSAMLLMLEDLNKATADIERAKNEWEATIDAISDPLFIHDKEFKVVRANKAYAEAGGMPFNEIIGKKYFEVFPKMDEPFKMCLKALELQEEEEVYLPSTDSIFKVRFYPIKAAEGKYLYSVHILEDITEIKMAEEKIKQEMEITSHLLASTLHDIGKIGTYEHLLDKPDKLTDEEFEL
ncbi:MAG: PAS domain-containing protein, partial [Deltaproteobacteria bacterium]|nr:PAS domain-containing protein [Deltaproteobacteria bacterium]